MTLQQLRYVIQIVDSGSITMASKKLFVSQPSLSKAVADLEKEMGITIFYRSNQGTQLSEEGAKFLSYARQVIEQADLLESRYKNNTPVKHVFAISAQHYAFVVNAFVALVKEYDAREYEFSLRESMTYDLIEDVRTLRSELGILFLSHFNHDVLLSIIHKANLEFVPLFEASPHVFISKKNPLAAKKAVTMSDLQPYPRLTYEQGINNSFYFSEELHSTIDCPKNIVVTDRATLFNLLIGLDGYTICSGILSSDLNGTEITAVPLESSEVMKIGYIHPTDRPLSAMSRRYLEHLENYVKSYDPLTA